MTWVAPKTDWVPANGVTDADLNRIEGNTLDNHNNITNYDNRTTLVTITVGPTGKNFTTISAAVNSLKKINAGPREIVVDAGTYSDFINLDGFHGGSVTLKSAGGSTAADVIINGSLNGTGCTAKLYVSNFKLSSVSASFTFTDCRQVECSYLEKSVSGLGRGLSAIDSQVYVKNTVFSNQGFSAFETYRSVLRLELISGFGNDRGINGLYGSIISKLIGYTLTATNADNIFGGSLLLT